MGIVDEFLPPPIKIHLDDGPHMGLPWYMSQNETTKNVETRSAILKGRVEFTVSPKRAHVGACNALRLKFIGREFIHNMQVHTKPEIRVLIQQEAELLQQGFQMPPGGANITVPPRDIPYSFPFEIELPNSLPGSISTRYGVIDYRLIVTLKNAEKPHHPISIQKAIYIHKCHGVPEDLVTRATEVTPVQHSGKCQDHLFQCRAWFPQVVYIESGHIQGSFELEWLGDVKKQPLIISVRPVLYASPTICTFVQDRDGSKKAVLERPIEYMSTGQDIKLEPKSRHKEEGTHASSDNLSSETHHLQGPFRLPFSTEDPDHYASSFGGQYITVSHHVSFEIEYKYPDEEEISGVSSAGKWLQRWKEKIVDTNQKTRFRTRFTLIRQQPPPHLGFD